MEVSRYAVILALICCEPIVDFCNPEIKESEKQSESEEKNQSSHSHFVLTLALIFSDRHRRVFQP